MNFVKAKKNNDSISDIKNEWRSEAGKRTLKYFVASILFFTLIVMASNFKSTLGMVYYPSIFLLGIGAVLCVGLGLHTDIKVAIKKIVLPAIIWFLPLVLFLIVITWLFDAWKWGNGDKYNKSAKSVV